jgi:hypothetical protein
VADRRAGRDRDGDQPPVGDWPICSMNPLRRMSYVDELCQL